MKFAFLTLGCRLNQYESDALITSFLEKGYTKTSFKDKADVYIINTCTVTSKSDAKSRNAIKRAIRTNPDALIVVTGCYSQTDKQDIEEIEGVNLIIPNKQKHGIPQAVEKYLRDKKKTSILEDPFNFTPPIKGEHTRSYLKIQEGCDNFCTYCKIPFARGGPSSRDFNETAGAFSVLVKSGIKEVVLTGINIGKVDYSLEALIAFLLKTEGDFRLHISSIEMPDVSDGIIKFLSNEKFAKHFHIPLQSGSDRILGLMERKYTKADYAGLVKQIRSFRPDVNITTDVLTGFPGETEDDHRMTLDVIKECAFSHVHTFAYSKRRGTKASLMKGHLSSDVKAKRSLEIRELSLKLGHKYKSRFIGKRLRMLAERNNIYVGDRVYSSGKTDNYIDVLVEGKVETSQFHNVLVTELKDDKLFGML